MSAWRIDQLTGTAGELHTRDARADGRRIVSVLDVTGPALVLGSTQSNELADETAAEEHGIEIVHRRTGGGAVFLQPGEAVWIDVIVPADDPLWDDDVARAFLWLGQVWATTLADLGIEGAVANETAVCHSILGRLICFAGLGFGEISNAGGKVVGLAQRRTRDEAWFQCAVMRRWDVEPYAALLAPGLAAAADDPQHALADVRVHIVDAAPAEVVDAFVDHLPAGS